MKWLVLGMIRWRALVLVAAFVWVAFGVNAWWRTPVDALPDLSDNQVLVYADWPDHEPEEIDRSITQPLSAIFSDVPHIDAVRGSSNVGFSLIHLIFDENTPLAQARDIARDRLNAASIRLPDGVEPQLSAEGSATGQIYAYTIEGIGVDLVELRRVQDQIIGPRLAQISGIAEVSSVGGFLPELEVHWNLTKLIAHEITLDEAEAALRPLLQDRSINAWRDVSTSNSRSEIVQSLEDAVIAIRHNNPIYLKAVGDVRWGTVTRQGALEKDGSEIAGGIVHLQTGANPLAVTRHILDTLHDVQDELPSNIRIQSCYDRTPLIQGAMQTVSRTLLESIGVATLCVVLIMRHWRTSLIITLPIPLAVLGAFAGMRLLNISGLQHVETNIMSLAGIVISIGALVDSSIVIAENVSHRLSRVPEGRLDHVDRIKICAEACATVAGPAVGATAIMIVSFLPIFALGGIDGNMYRPLAWTKTLTLVSIAVITLSLVPALCFLLIRGKIQLETESRLLRSLIGIYAFVLDHVLRKPLPVVLLLIGLLMAGAAVMGWKYVLLAITIGTIGGVWYGVGIRTASIASVALVILCLSFSTWVEPIRLALRIPLDEGMIMDMPITIPRISLHQAVDDLKIRNMTLCRFPEVRMAVGKVGRADTAFDPAPIDMIETMVELRSKEFWPRRRITDRDSAAMANALIEELKTAKLIEVPEGSAALDEIIDTSRVHFDAVQREVCWQLLQRFERELADEMSMYVAQQAWQAWSPTDQRRGQAQAATLHKWLLDVPLIDRLAWARQPHQLTLHQLVLSLHKAYSHPHGSLGPSANTESLRTEDQAIEQSRILHATDPAEDSWEKACLKQSLRLYYSRWRNFVLEQNEVLSERAVNTWLQAVCHTAFQRLTVLDDSLARRWEQIYAVRYGNSQPESHHAGHTGIPGTSPLPIVDPHPVFDNILKQLRARYEPTVWLWPHDIDSLSGSHGELDRALQLPGWANVWTKPIQNRVDMLTTGMQSEVGLRVLGDDFQTVVQTSEAIAQALAPIPGALQVLADPVRDRNTLAIAMREDGAATSSMSSAPDAQRAHIERLVELATRGRRIGTIARGGRATPVRMFVQASDDNTDFNDLPIRVSHSTHDSSSEPAAEPNSVKLSDVAMVGYREGPATIKRENGQLRNYVRVTLKDRDPLAFIADANRTVQANVALSAAIELEWTGQYEHARRTQATLRWIIPIALAIILSILYLTYRDLADAALMFIAVPGALAGGAICQWLLGYPLSLAVGVGYLACCGMAAATSMIMLVYLREAVAAAGPLEKLSLTELRQAVISGAAHRLRPKLLTETTMVFSLVPLLWSSGFGADVIRPMAAPVLGGILVADEVIDLLIPIAFYAVRKRRWQRLTGRDASGTD